LGFIKIKLQAIAYCLRAIRYVLVFPSRRNLGLAFHYIASLLLNGCNARVVNLLSTNSNLNYPLPDSLSMLSNMLNI